jgi:hypothetical protein
LKWHEFKWRHLLTLVCSFACFFVLFCFFVMALFHNKIKWNKVKRIPRNEEQRGNVLSFLGSFFYHRLMQLWPKRAFLSPPRRQERFLFSQVKQISVFSYTFLILKFLLFLNLLTLMLLAIYKGFNLIYFWISCVF